MVDRVIDLDSGEFLSRTDRSGMLEVLEAFPDQVRRALEIGSEDIGLPACECLNSVAVLGMGGSGISGDVVSALVADTMRLPVVTVKGYRLPAFVGEDSLVFAVSYSGNTEETVNCLEEALRRGAKVVAVSGGGRITGMAEESGIPVYRIPGGLQPRASLGYLTVPIIAALERIGLAVGVLGQVEAAAGMLEERSVEYGRSAPLEANPTKRLARDLVGYMPVIYGSEGHLAVAAKRWKTQFNENSKVPAFENSFPELNHNETVGWLELADICSRSHLVVLREREEHRRVGKRIEITCRLLADHVGPITQICARGANRVERLLDLVYFGDFTSVYLAIALGQDPTPVARIEELKKRLAETGD